MQDIFIADTGAPLIYANRSYGVPQRFHQRFVPNARDAPPAEAALALGCFQTFAPYVVPALVARLKKLHPGIALTLVEADQRNLLASLHRGELDLALLYDFGIDPVSYTHLDVYKRQS